MSTNYDAKYLSLLVSALFELPQQDCFKEKNAKFHLPVTLILDRINDPGNMGSLIRSGACFGLDSILVTKGTHYI